MMTTNYHTHTFRSNHASGTEREYIEMGISRGLKILGFSDHIACDFPEGYISGFRMREDKLEDYFRTLSDLKKEYEKDIEILIGFESEYYPAFFERTLRMLEPYPCQYLLLGQHFSDNEYDTHLYNGTATNDSAVLEKYVNQTLEGLKTGNFTYFAHPDLIRYEPENEIFRREITRLCQGAKALNIPLELNCLGMAEKRHYPREGFWKIAAETGNEVIIGCDAHSPEAVAEPNAYRACWELAQRLHLKVVDSVQIRKLRG